MITSFWHFVSLCFFVLASIFAFINIFFISEHARMYKECKHDKHPVLKANCERFQIFVFRIGLIILFLIFFSCWSYPPMLNNIVGPYIIYRLSVPIIIWLLSYGLVEKIKKRLINKIFGIKKTQNKNLLSE